MWEIFRKNIFIICFTCLMLIPKLGICSDFDDATKAVKAGYKLVETFYSCLTSDIKQDFCGKIFLHYPYMSKNENDLIWKYLNKNKQLFVYKSNTVKDKEFFKWSRKSISYFNPTNLDKLSDGYLYVTVVHTFPDKFYAGIYKEIAFPIVRDEASGEFRIVFYNIKINGILIDYKNEFVRDFDIIENLGFKSEQNRNKLNQKQ